MAIEAYWMEILTLAGIRQEKMAGVSHWLHLDRPTEFNAVLDRFLAGIPD